MGGFLWLMFLNLGMFVGTMLAGYLPLMVRMQAGKMQLMTLFGSGLLVGSAFAVILPEGVATLYARRDELDKTNEETNSLNLDKRALHSGNESDATKDDKSPNIKSVEKDAVAQDNSRLIGLCLILGFITMFLVDQLGFGNTPKSHSHATYTVIDDTQSEPTEAFQDTESIDSPAQIPLTNRRRSSNQKQQLSSSVTSVSIGLFVHALTDGISLGAASFSDSSKLGFLIFLAVMLHKTPSAFGLTSFLLKDAHRQKIQPFTVVRFLILKHLCLFALAAPIGAILCYLLLTLFISLNTNVSSEKWIGCLLLFSAGTFIYVATIHIFPEASSSLKANSSVELRAMQRSRSDNDVGNRRNSTTVDCDHQNDPRNFKQTIAFLIGIVFPLILGGDHE